MVIERLKTAKTVSTVLKMSLIVENVVTEIWMNENLVKLVLKIIEIVLEIVEIESLTLVKTVLIVLKIWMYVLTLVEMEFYKFENFVMIETI